jgi:predicted lipid-binding transport protein (Tim44 family)
VKPITAGLVVAATAALLAADFSDARRLSGGRSMGAQRPASPTQPATPPSQAGSPAAGSTTNAAPSTAPGAGAASNPVLPPSAGASAAARPGAPTAAAAKATGTRSSWMGPVAGLAAGLGLAALASHFGFSDELASFLLIGLLALAAVFVVRLLLSRRDTARAPLPYAGAGAGLGTTPGGYETQVPPPARFEPVFGGPVLGAPGMRALPENFDAEAFAREAKKQFLAVQTAHDRHDAKSLADVMTPELHREIVREMDTSGAARPTEIVDVDAEVVDVSTEGTKHWASVRFSGTAREGGVLEPFDEVWNLVKPVDGSSGWLIAGIQQQVMPS